MQHVLTAALASQASLFADLSRDIKLQDQVYEKAREWEARLCRAHGARLSRSDDSLACAEQELDKQSVDTNALLKLATAHVRAEPRARARVRFSAARLTPADHATQLAELRRAFDEETKLVEASLEQACASEAAARHCVSLMRRVDRIGARIWTSISGSLTT